MSEFDNQLICTLCFNHQCSHCGRFSEEEDPEDEQFVWYAGNLYCEECSVSYLCNCCGGECAYPCPICERAHDNECQCEIECAGCDEVFEYRGYDMWDRCHNSLWNLDRRKLCDDCWKDLLNGGGK